MVVPLASFKDGTEGLICVTLHNERILTVTWLFYRLNRLFETPEIGYIIDDIRPHSWKDILLLATFKEHRKNVSTSKIYELTRMIHQYHIHISTNGGGDNILKSEDQNHVSLQSSYKMPEPWANDGQIGCVNTLRPRQNGRHFADDTFKRIYWIKILEFRLRFHWSLFL